MLPVFAAGAGLLIGAGMVWAMTRNGRSIVSIDSPQTTR